MKLSQEEIDRRFELAVDAHQEHLLSKTGKMYPFNPDNLQEAIAEMSDGQKILIAYKIDLAEKSRAYYSLEYAEVGQFLIKISRVYWADAAKKEANAIVQKNFNPDNCV